MPLFYADSSALVKLVLDEPESVALDDFLDGAALASSELAITEVQRAVRRPNAGDEELDLDVVLQHAAALLETIAFRPVDRKLLIAAGGLAEPALRTLDAIHIATALALAPLDGLLTYDLRQAAAARLSGLRTFTPSD